MLRRTKTTKDLLAAKYEFNDMSSLKRLET